MPDTHHQPHCEPQQAYLFVAPPWIEIDNLKESNMKLCYLLKDNLILLLQAYKDDNIDESKVVVYPEDEREAAEHVEESDEDLIDIDKGM